MNSILNIRDALRSVYSRYGTFIVPVLKILLAFLMLAVIQKNIGYNEKLSKPVVMAAASVLCAFFPYGFISFICAAFVILDMFEISVMTAVFAAVVGIMIFVLYYGFRPGSGIIIAIVPLLFYFRIPFAVPLILGLAAGIYSAVPAALGVLCWNIIHYFAENAESFVSGEMSGSADELIVLAKTIFRNEYMYLVMFAFVLCICAVSIISRSSIDHCWIVSVFAGTAILAVFMVIGGAVIGEGSFLADTAGLLVSFLIAVFYVLVIFSVDFSRTEHLSYEDDDYYYYVKAVPKIKDYDGDGGL